MYIVIFYEFMKNDKKGKVGILEFIKIFIFYEFMKNDKKGKVGILVFIKNN